MSEDMNNEDYGLKTLSIGNRRYLGNKYKLINTIREIVDRHCKNVNTFADIFAGTGAVASAFIDKYLIINDILYSNYICHVAWFSRLPCDIHKIKQIIIEYNKIIVNSDNYMSINFGNTYFSVEDCRKIGFIRDDIEVKASRGEINFRERAVLITSLLYAMDKIANTVGHYDAFRKGVEFEKSLELRLPMIESTQFDNECYNEDANKLVKHLVADVIFMDPPYNSRQYSDAYHLLENVARWEKPEVKGVARKMDCSKLKSNYCTTKAELAFSELVRSLRAHYIILTYNNMENKGNGRSNAKLSDKAIMDALKLKGTVQIFEVEHKAFSTGKSNRADNIERVFLCKCFPTVQIASPLNYTGGKFKILKQILPYFPTNTRTFMDLFCGGCNVGVNVDARKVIFTDSCEPLIELFVTMKSMENELFIESVKTIIKRFGLSDSETNGYSFYNCDSSRGLGGYNKEPYFRLRHHYASLPNDSLEKSVVLYVLILFCFNNQIRFNSRGQFNLPVGKRDFNSKMKAKLEAFMTRLKERDYEFQCSEGLTSIVLEKKILSMLILHICWQMQHTMRMEDGRSKMSWIY